MMEDALSFDGNTGPYVQYTYARACSVLEKCGVSEGISDSDFTEPEFELAKVLSVFPERVNAALADYEPSNVTRYTLDLAAAFNRFYHECKIATCEDETVRQNRVALTAATKQVLKTALTLICMKTPEKI